MISPDMTQGQKFIKENFATELTYADALKCSIDEIRSLGIVDEESFYNSNGSYLDTPVYPCNAELYDEFVDEYGFDEDSFVDYCVRMMAS